MSKFLKVSLIFFTLTNTALAQDNKWGTWGIVNIQMPGDSSHKWGGFIELQTRSNDLFNQFNYYETKGAVSYDLDKNFTVALGGGRYATHDYNNIGAGPIIQEGRVWQQLTYSQYLKRVKFEHRYRIEQRWLNGLYRNRFRYRLNAFIPLNSKKIDPGTYFISVFDEIFLNNKEPHFERNRFSAGLGYQFSKKFNMQVAWLNQYNYVPGKGSAKNNIAFTFMYRILRKNAGKNEHYLPSIPD